jgi:transcriptional regulator with XRE-family HTH domain
MTREQAIAILRKQQGVWSLRQYAEHLGVSAAYLSDVYLGRRDLGPKLLKPLGLRKIKTSTIVYEKGKS